MRRFMQTLWTLVFAIMLSGLAPQVQAAEKMVKVFILAGQSNMEGHGQVRSLDHLGEHPKHGDLLKKLKNADGSWVIRKDVTIYWKAKDRKTGPLTIGWGASENEIGPELMFGTIMGDKYNEPVLLIKTAWGGKDMYCDFRSPSAGKPTVDEELILKREHSENRNREIGLYYRKMVSEIKDCLANIENIVPGYNGQNYEIVGMAWFQGWNDFCEWHLQLDGKRVDMETFALWGVDYIKMDSCFAENNGRMSSEDYAMYREGIEATGRPIVLSISDFGNAAWAWGGKESAQLWRTSNDIYPWMDSIYACANTSAGDQAIHPAFNGLWQFAGPGHWNDPDMLQVGNLKGLDEDRKDIADRAHFSLWCILAAPLMAGNDLRTMSDNVRKVLTAPELIAVNQDHRGIQGYKVFEEAGCEVYNKPLSDGTTAVLLLNKGRKEASITLQWDKIGLSGNQPVRDLWACEDLGEFKDSFTAHNLGQHEHKMIKVGRPGPPLPAPSPMPLEKYTVTRKGETYLSDLCYIWKAGNAPIYNATYTGDPIKIYGQTFKKGLGCKSKCAVMFKVDGRADRFRAIVAMDISSKENAEGRFRVYNEDFFANKVLWDSGKMTKDSPAKEIDIELKDVQCLMLVFDGKEVLGNWADARVISENINK